MTPKHRKAPAADALFEGSSWTKANTVVYINLLTPDLGRGYKVANVIAKDTRDTLAHSKAASVSAVTALSICDRTKAYARPFDYVWDNNLKGSKSVEETVYVREPTRSTHTFHCLVWKRESTNVKRSVCTREWGLSRSARSESIGKIRSAGSLRRR